MSKRAPDSPTPPTTPTRRHCGVPVVPPPKLDPSVRPGRARLFRLLRPKWANHTVLHYHFLERPPTWMGDADANIAAVERAFAEWKSLGIGLEFQRVASAADAEIRIAFRNDGSWSYVGRDALRIKDPREPTMNLGWKLTDDYGYDTALHEIGHAIGFPHEHHSPYAGIEWNEAAVYDYFSGEPNNWDRETIHYNVLRKLDPAEVEGAGWDPNSIMHYQFPAGLIDQPEAYRDQPLVPAGGLSPADKAVIRRLFPPKTGKPLPLLIPYASQTIDLGPGEQLDFAIRPEYSRDYVIRTFGTLDTVMVLFEIIDGRPRYVCSDDDGGTNLNAKLEHRLVRRREYVLRLRLYCMEAKGHAALMMW